MSHHIKFTQEIKDKWLKALKSGKYKQHTCTLSNSNKTGFCCIGVLGHILPNYVDSDTDVIDKPDSLNPYELLSSSPVVGPELTTLLWQTNDDIVNTSGIPFFKVIPVVENLEVEDV